jgi:hypothetical protein
MIFLASGRIEQTNSHRVKCPAFVGRRERKRLSEGRKKLKRSPSIPEWTDGPPVGLPAEGQPRTCGAVTACSSLQRPRHDPKFDRLIASGLQRLNYRKAETSLYELLWRKLFLESGFYSRLLSCQCQ